MAAAPVLIRPLVAVVMTRRGRWLAVVISLGCAAVLITAAAIEPNHRGTGTHHQLGLQPCQFLQRTGLPCGTCGMTTSFAYFAHGNLIASTYLQPFGAALALATAMTFWAAGYCAATGRPAYRLLWRIPPGWAIGLILAFWVLAWAWKIWLVVGGRDGW